MSNLSTFLENNVTKGQLFKNLPGGWNFSENCAWKSVTSYFFNSIYAENLKIIWKYDSLITKNYPSSLVIIK